MSTLTGIYHQAMDIIRKHHMVQQNFALSVSIQIWDEARAGEVAAPVELISIDYRHREYPLQSLAFANEPTREQALHTFERELLEARVVALPGKR